MRTRPKKPSKSCMLTLLFSSRHFSSPTSSLLLQVLLAVYLINLQHERSISTVPGLAKQHASRSIILLTYQRRRCAPLKATNNYTNNIHYGAATNLPNLRLPHPLLPFPLQHQHPPHQQMSHCSSLSWVQ